LKVGEALGSTEQVADQHECPALADEFEGVRKPAVLAVAACLHAITVAGLHKLDLLVYNKYSTAKQDYPETTMTEPTLRTEPDPRRWWALALLCGAFFMVILDAAIVPVALPSIEKDLGFTAQGLQWVVSAYALTFAGLLLLGGRAADLLGRRRMFMIGLVLFTLASLLCGLAWSDKA